MKKIKVLAISLVIVILTLLTSMFCLMASADNGSVDTNTTSTVATTEEAEKAEETQDNATGMKAIASAVVVGLVAAAGAVSMALAIKKTTESMARQPEIADKINSTMMLGLVFIETAIIYALIIAILIIFVL